MKKYLLAAGIIALLMPTVASAQLPPKPNIDLGIKAGANFAQLNGDNWEGGYKVNYLAGLFTGLRFKKFGVQVEGFFSQTKYTTSGQSFYDKYNSKVEFRPGANTTKKSRFNVGYINIPVLFQYKVLPFIWAQAGPQYAGVVSVRDVDDLVQDSKQLFKDGSFCGVIGLEAKLPVKLVVGARYVFGLSDVNNTSTSGAWQQNTIQVHLGLSFL